MIKLDNNEKYYSIHNLVTFKTIDKFGFPKSYFNNIEKEYKNFEVKWIENPDLTIDIGDFVPNNGSCTILDSNYYIKRNYFFCSDSHKIAKWKFEMSEFENGSMKVKIFTNFFASMIISGFLIDPIINYILNKKGYTLIHGSCISDCNGAYLFTSQGGGGKTSIALYSVEKGYNFLGDNFVVLDKGIIRSFLSPLNIFSFNSVPIIMNNMEILSKIEFHLKNLLYKLTRLRLVTKINVKDIFPNSLSDCSKLELIAFLMPKENFGMEEISKEELIGHMVANMKLDSFPFIKYMLLYSYIFSESEMARHWDLYEENLRKNLNDAIIYKVEVPLKFDMKTFNKISEMVL